mgnify:CR=1 FL=1
MMQKGRGGVISPRPVLGFHFLSLFPISKGQQFFIDPLAVFAF